MMDIVGHDTFTMKKKITLRLKKIINEARKKGNPKLKKQNHQNQNLKPDFNFPS